MTDAVAAIAGPAVGAPGVVAPPAAGAAFAWDTTLDAPIVDLLKSKGMYDDPVKGSHGLAKSYYELNRLHSGAADVVGVPADWTKAEDVEKFLSKTRGVAKAEEYVVTLPDGVKLDPNLAAFSQKLAHDWGVPKALFNKGIEAWTKFAGEQNAAFEATQAKNNSDAITALKSKVGEEVYNAGVANAQSVYKALAAKGLISRETLGALDKTLGSAPLMELLFAIGANMKAEGGVLGNGGTPAPTDPTQMTPEQAGAAINALRGDKEFMAKYEDGKHSEHKVAVERMRLLYEAQTRRPA